MEGSEGYTRVVLSVATPIQLWLSLITKVHTKFTLTAINSEDVCEWMRRWGSNAPNAPAYWSSATLDYSYLHPRGMGWGSVIGGGFVKSAPTNLFAFGNFIWILAWILHLHTIWEFVGNHFYYYSHSPVPFRPVLPGAVQNESIPVRSGCCREFWEKGCPN